MTGKELLLVSSFISALTNSTTGITADGLWGDLAAAVPFIVIIFGIAFGYHILKRTLKSGSKQKVNF